MTDKYAKLREAAEKATPGPWRTFNGTDVYPDDDDREGTRHIADCDMDGAIGGDEQRANAAFIAAANPQTVLALLDHLAAEKARADAAEAQSAARKTMIEGLELLVKDAEEKITLMEGMGIDQMLSDRPVYSRRQIIERIAAAEATIARLTEQLAEAKRGLKKIATKTQSTLGYYGPGLSAYEAFETARATLSRLEKQEGEK